MNINANVLGRRRSSKKAINNDACVSSEDPVFAKMHAHNPLGRRRSSLGSEDNEEVAARALHRVQVFEKKSKFRDVTKENSVRKLHVEDIVAGKLLGSGAFSNVYEARLPTKALSGVVQTGDDYCYALKQLKLAVMDDPKHYATGAIDLAMEAKFLASTSHKNIAKLHGVTAGCISEAFSSGIEGSYFIVLDKMACTLKDLLKVWAEDCSSNQSSWGTLFKASTASLPSKMSGRLCVALGIAEGLEYLHANNIVYRDIKPDNIGIDAFGNVKIFDFGLAKELLPEDERRPTGMAGTPRYMAPEVARTKHYGLSCDTYSFGILLWEILALETPYGKLGYKIWSDEVVYGFKRPSLKKPWPRRIKSLMEECWDPEPSYRPKMKYVVEAANGAMSKQLGRKAGSKLALPETLTPKVTLKSSVHAEDMNQVDTSRGVCRHRISVLGRKAGSKSALPETLTPKVTLKPSVHAEDMNQVDTSRGVYRHRISVRL